MKNGFMSHYSSQTVAHMSCFSYRRRVKIQRGHERHFLFFFFNLLDSSSDRVSSQTFIDSGLVQKGRLTHALAHCRCVDVLVLLEVLQ